MTTYAGEMYPDEDFIGQVLQKQSKVDKGLFEVTKDVDLSLYQHHWKDSLNCMGCVCYRGKIPEQIPTFYKSYLIVRCQL